LSTKPLLPTSIQKYGFLGLVSSGGSEMTTANAMKIETGGRATESMDLTTRTDREVLDACIQKDDAAWRELHRRFDKPMRIEAYKRLGARLVARLPSDYDDD